MGTYDDTFVFVINGTDVEPRDVCKDFRGQAWKFVRISSPPMAGKTGRVLMSDEFDRTREFYPTVFDGEIAKRE